MDVGQKVWTSSVFTHGYDSPYVYLTERTVIAVIDSGAVVEAKNHPTIVEQESKLYASKADAAAAAIQKLLLERQVVLSRYDAEIEKLKKSRLQDASVPV
jgi:hypothetical protein